LELPHLDWRAVARNDSILSRNWSNSCSLILSRPESRRALQYLRFQSVARTDIPEPRLIAKLPPLRMPDIHAATCMTRFRDKKRSLAYSHTYRAVASETEAIFCSVGPVSTLELRCTVHFHKLFPPRARIHTDRSRFTIANG
jgi:hypothetical protein